ncbi:hypothetical protein [Paracnuella aquatica]
MAHRFWDMMEDLRIFSVPFLTISIAHWDGAYNEPTDIGVEVCMMGRPVYFVLDTCLGYS